MRRGGVLSFVCYLIILLGGLAFVIFGYAQEVYPSAAFGIFIVVLVFDPIVLKLIYFATGFRIFGFLCALIDIALIALILLICQSDHAIYIVFSPILLFSFLSIFSDLATLRQ